MRAQAKSPTPRAPNVSLLLLPLSWNQWAPCVSAVQAIKWLSQAQLLAPGRLETWTRVHPSPHFPECRRRFPEYCGPSPRRGTQLKRVNTAYRRLSNLTLLGLAPLMHCLLTMTAMSQMASLRILRLLAFDVTVIFPGKKPPRLLATNHLGKPCTCSGP